jgi:transposase
VSSVKVSDDRWTGRLRELHAQGFSITDISDKTGYDWKTVKKYLNSTTIPEPKQRAKKERKLDQYKDHIGKTLPMGLSMPTGKADVIF